MRYSGAKHDCPETLTCWRRPRFRIGATRVRAVRRASAGWLIVLIATATCAQAGGDEMLIDDFSGPDLMSQLGTRWRGFSDRVMGGMSDAAISLDSVDGRNCLRLAGRVRLENNGGFIQAALDLDAGGGTLDATAYRGIRLVVRGNGEQYSIHLRTPDNVRPWQSYRAHFTPGDRWETIELPFSEFFPYRTERPLDLSRLRRLGVVAIGRAFYADVAVAELSLYR
jgi:hypothetical protein